MKHCIVLMLEARVTKGTYFVSQFALDGKSPNDIPKYGDFVSGFSYLEAKNYFLDKGRTIFIENQGTGVTVEELYLNNYGALTVFVYSQDERVVNSYCLWHHYGGNWNAEKKQA